MDRLLVDAAGTLTLGVTSAAGSPADFDALPTITVYDGAGVQLATGSAVHDGTGSYSFTYTPHILDTIRIVWSGNIAAVASVFTTYAEVVGAVPLTVADVRGRDEDLNDTVKYPTGDVQDAIDAAWEQAEKSMRVAVVPKGRWYSETYDGAGSLVLPDNEIRSLVALTVDGTASDITNYVALATGVVEGLTGSALGFARGSALAVHYTHGWDFPPAQVKRAMRLLAQYYLVGDGSAPSRATSLSTDVGSFRLTVAGRDGDTGLPEVDAVFAAFGYGRLPEFA